MTIHCPLLRPLALLPALLLAACAGGITGSAAERLATAQAIAGPAGFTRQTVAANGFDITTFRKITAAGQQVTVYIEGDGRAWMSRTRPARDPTPPDPLALRLAALDRSANVIYLARPCHYSRGAACAEPYWTHRRFAPEAVDALEQALNAALPAPHGGIRLVGFSGGGAMAALLAARRGDVIDLRTIAGNLAIAAHSDLHGVSPLSGSLDPVHAADRLRAIPQHHFIGGQDTIVPPEIFRAYAAALGDQRCTHRTIVPEAAHEDGWPDFWRGGQAVQPACAP